MLGAAQVERLSSNFISFSFQLQDALTQGLALRSQRRAINQHAIAFNSKQSFAGGNFNVVDGAQLGIGLNARPQHTMHIQALIGVFARILRSFFYIDLRKRNLMRTFAAQIFVSDTCAPHMAQSQAGQTVGLVHFKHIALKHGVVRIAFDFNTHIGEHMAVVFDVLTHFEFEWVFKPWFEFGQHLIHG